MVPYDVKSMAVLPSKNANRIIFGVNDGPITIGGWFEPLAGATIGPYPEPNPRKSGIDFDGGIKLYPKPNTGIFIENINYGYKNLYSFHDKGPGRMEGPF